MEKGIADKDVEAMIIGIIDEIAEDDLKSAALAFAGRIIEGMRREMELFAELHDSRPGRIDKGL